VNSITDVDGDHATANNYVVVMTTGSSPANPAMGRCIDTLERVEGQWQMAARLSHADQAIGH